MRLYSSIAQPTTLATGISNSDTTISVMATVGYPAISPGNTFTVALDYGGATEELVDVTAVAGNVWTVTRGVDGTSAQSHSPGAIVRHTSSGRDFADMQAHIAATSGVHGVTGALVGTTNTQTLTNKTFTAPTINAGALSGTFTGTPQLSGAVLFTGDPIFQGATAADTAASVRVAADSNPRLAMRADGALVLGSGSGTGDTTLARTGAGALGLTGSLAVSNGVSVTGATHTEQPNATDVIYNGNLTGDANWRYTVTADGKVGWGPGTTTRDTFLYRTGVGALKTDGALQVAGDMTVSGIGQRVFAIKTSNTSRANTAAPAADPHLQLSLAANSTYEIRGLIVWGNSTSGDLNLNFDSPGATDGWWYTVQPSVSVTTTPVPVRVIATRTNTGRVYGYVDEGSGDPNGLQLTGVIQTTSAITLHLLWSQATSNATPTILYAQSYLVAERVA